MADGFIVRKGGVSSETTAAPTITIVSETGTDVTFTLKNNDDNTALITFEIDDQIGGVELAAAAVSSNITVALAAGTYTLSAFATVVGEVATSATVSVEIVIPEYEELFSTTVATAVTEIDITGLSIGKADTLQLVCTIVSTDSFALKLFVNNVTSETNYFTQDFGGNGTSLSANRRANQNSIAFLSNGSTQILSNIKVSNNNRFVISSGVARNIGANASTLTNGVSNVILTDTITSITSLKIFANGTNSILANSKIALYKVTEAA